MKISFKVMIIMVLGMIPFSLSANQATITGLDGESNVSATHPLEGDKKITPKVAAPTTSTKETPKVAAPSSTKVTPKAPPAPTGGSFQISGSQTHPGVGNKLSCSPTNITKAAKVVGVSGTNDGFWIVNSATGQVFARYHTKNDPKVIGKAVPVGKYCAYPNVAKPAPSLSTVVLTLKWP